MVVSITSQRLADTLHSATPNLFGSVLVCKPIDTYKNKEKAALYAAKFGTLYKEYSITGFTTLKNYENAVNNALERDEQEREFEVSDHKWAKPYKGSHIIIEHKTNGRLYLNIRLTKNAQGKSKWLDSKGKEYTYEEVEPFLKSPDRRETKRKSIAATAAHQGLEEEDSVQIRAIPLDTIKTLKYGGTVYKTVPETVGAVSTPVAVVAEPVKARTPILVSVYVLTEHNAGADPAALELAVVASLYAAELPDHDGIRMVTHAAINVEITENA